MDTDPKFPPWDNEKLVPLKLMLLICKQKPGTLHDPNLAFIKEFVEYFGGHIPGAPPPETNPNPNPEPESEDSDLELDTTGVIEPDMDAPQKMGNPTLQPTEEEIAEYQAKRSEAVSAFVEKDYDKAIQLYTDAITLNPQASLLYAKRGQIFLLLNKPNACIRDCDRALELNPDSAAAHKFRGRAHQMLGKWEQAASDLRLACKFDYDEEVAEWLRQVTPNSQKIEEHKREKERKRQEKAYTQQREAREKQKKEKESAKASEETSRSSQTDAGAGARGMGDFFKFFNDPEVTAAMMDPEVSEAFADITRNPMNIMKYQNNPKMMALINKMSAKYGGVDGNLGARAAAAAMMGGMGMPGAGAQFDGPKPNEPKPGPQDDVGLD